MEHFLIRRKVQNFLQVAGLLVFLSSCSISGRISALNSKTGLTEFITVSSKIVAEFGIASIPVVLSSAQIEDVTFTYYTRDETAVASTDYVSVSGTATILAGQTQVILSIPIADNLLKATNKKFSLQIGSVSISKLGMQSGLIEIQDDDYTDASLGYSQLGSGGSNYHTCALSTAGGVKCWGRNNNGQLGDATTTDRSLPVDVTGLSTGYQAVAMGNSHTCALTAGGGVKCWGLNTNGQLGDGSTTQRTTPVDVTGLTSGVIAISLGTSHSCALMAGGGMKCWGDNTYSQIGDGSTTQRTTAVDVTGLTSGVQSIATGNYHTCALLTATSGLKCWGYNGSAGLGDGSTTTRSTAVDVTGLTSGVQAVSAGGSHTCALLIATNGLKCWGYNAYGQIGDGSTTQRTTAVDVTGLTSGVQSIVLGYYHTCALTTSGGAKCWGLNSSGQVGDGSTTQRTTAVDVTGLTSGVQGITLGGNGGHSCALTAAGGIQCWGSNFYGQIGDGSSIGKATAVDVDGFTGGVRKISLGSSHSCALTTSGGMKCWGSNAAGQLGDNSTISKITPVDVDGLTSGVQSIAAGYFHTCALTTGGGVKCWGLNTNGQLGDGSTTQRTTAVDVTGLTSGVQAIAVGETHSCALTASGGVMCWGYNVNGRLGDGFVSGSQSVIPVNVTGLTSGVQAIAVGYSHSCAIVSGFVKCWGLNTSGQLGNGSTISSTTAVDVTGLSGVQAIDLGSYSTCALTTGGAVKCWGLNNTAQIGDGSTTDRSSPVDPLSMASGVQAVNVGASHACILTSSGGMKCWGASGSGQLGTTYTNTLPHFVKQP